jgi:hypothetical protein
MASSIINGGWRRWIGYVVFLAALILQLYCGHPVH